jgi:hypothetical protein
MWVPEGDTVYRVAEQGDAEQHPIWVYSLIESRAVTLQVRGRKRVILVKTVSTEMRPGVWDRCVEWYPDDTLYLARIERQIPVFACSSPQ